MSTVYEDYLFACARVTPNRRYYEAFSFVRQKIRLGTPDEVIIQEFRVLHNTLPTVYSIAKGKTLTQEVLDKFKRGLIEMDRRQEQRRILNQKKLMKGLFVIVSLEDGGRLWPAKGILLRRSSLTT